jgi:uracil-DNA glycosylase
MTAPLIPIDEGAFSLPPIPDLTPIDNVSGEWSEATRVMSVANGAEGIMYQATSNIPPGWERVFTGEARREIEHACNIISRRFAGLRFAPPAPLVFQAFRYTPLDKVKVVLIGQDPFYTRVKRGPRAGMSQAVGLSFSIHPDDPDVPDSTVNIYKELATEYPFFTPPRHGDLRRWALQGVLLLNACLTVIPKDEAGGGAGTHGKIWNGFLVHVIQAIATANRYCVYILLGRDAQAITSYLPNTAIVHSTSHPSPLAAHRGFFGSDLFKKVNESLIAHDQTPINWGEL